MKMEPYHMDSFCLAFFTHHFPHSSLLHVSIVSFPFYCCIVFHATIIDYSKLIDIEVVSCSEVL